MLRSEFGHYQNITTATTTVVKTGRGVLVLISCNGATTGTVTVYDNTAASGTKIATLPVGSSGTYGFLVQFTTGCTVVTTQADNITVSYD